jgi:hypothetical protein
MELPNRKAIRSKSQTYLAGFGLATMMISPASAQSITPASTNGFQHFVDCFGALLGNPSLHTQNCAPGQILPDSTITSGGGAYVPDVPDVEFDCESPCAL